MRPLPRIALTLAALAGLVSGCDPYPYLATRGHGEPYAWIRFVGKAPPASRYQSAGVVEGVAPETDFVAAARSARADIRYKAAQLGADVIRIEQVKLPPAHRPRGRASVLLVGRAYRQLDATPRTHS